MLPTEHRFFKGRVEEVNLGRVHILDNYLIRGLMCIGWLERLHWMTSKKSSSEFSILTLLDGKWERILNRITGENSAIRPSKDWLSDLDIEAREWRGSTSTSLAHSSSVKRRNVQISFERQTNA